MVNLWKKLDELPMPTEPSESLEQLWSCLEEIEDTYSRVEKQEPPPKLKESDGRMYRALDDFIHQNPHDSSIIAFTKGHIVYVAPNGVRKVVEKITDNIVYQDLDDR